MDEKKRKSAERGYRELLDGLGDFVTDDDDFIEETLRALEEFELTGEHATDEQIRKVFDDAIKKARTAKK